VKKLLEIEGNLNKGYHVFNDNYFMSVPLVHHFHELRTYITGNVRNRKLLPQQFKNKFAVGKKMHCRSGPFLVRFPQKSTKKNLSLFSPATPQPKKRKNRKDIVAIHK
jgi:hypothetical protein